MLLKYPTHLHRGSGRKKTQAEEDLVREEIDKCVKKSLRKVLSFDFGARCRPAHRETLKEVRNAKAKKTAGGVKTVMITKGAGEDMNQKSHYFGRPSSEETKEPMGKMFYNGNTTENVNVEPPLRYM